MLSKSSMPPTPQTRMTNEEEEEDVMELFQQALRQSSRSISALPPYPTVDEINQASVLLMETAPEVTTTTIMDTAEATVIGETYDDELIAMKMAAANGPAQDPTPFADEDFLSFISRTQNYWIDQAADAEHPMREAKELAYRRYQMCQYNSNNRHQEATVVAITEGSAHPSDTAAVQAELIGQDYRTISLTSSTTSEQEMHHVAADQVQAIEEETAEATVIDSAPINSNDDDIPHWKTPEEAQVLEEDYLNQKPSAEEYAVVADQEAEVVGIQEEVHPSEFQNNDAQAELVGTDYNYATVQASDVALEHEGGHEVVREATVVASEHVNGLDPPMDYTASVKEVYEPLRDRRRRNDPEPSQSIDSPVVGVADDEYTLSWIQTPTGNQEDLPTPLDPPALDGESVPDWLHVPTPTREPTDREPSMSAQSEQSSRSNNGIQALSSNLVRGTSQVIGALFGSKGGQDDDLAAQSIHPRTLLPWSVIYSSNIKMWVATVQTNQRALDSNDTIIASRSLRAFSLPSEAQAISLARSWTPPRMLSFDDHPNCHICQQKFALLRRRCHCRNCGVCVCKECATQWPAKMLPETYNVKKENSLNVCKACDWLCHAFRLALLEGNQDRAVALHATGNVNVTSPFANVKGELFYPVHCAALGGNLNVLRWLVDDLCCPVKSVRITSNGKRDQSSKLTPIVTSKGRSLLGIALENQHLHMLRYLVVTKNLSLRTEKDITHDMLVQCLSSLLFLIPETAPMGGPEAPFAGPSAPSEESLYDSFSDDHPAAIPGKETAGRSFSEEARNFGAVHQHDVSIGIDEESLAGESVNRRDECIICFDGKIDCVATPCGHAMCCLNCSENLERCPVCASDCSFMRVYKP